MAIRYLLWDWNGTLFDDTRLCMSIVNSLLEKRKRSIIDIDTYREVFGFPVKDYYVRLGFDFGAEAWEDVAAEFIVAYESRRHECGLREKSREVLSACGRLGVRQMILSAYAQPTLEEIVRLHGLESHFMRLCGLDNHYADGKIGIGRRLIRELDADPGQVLMVGDTTHDWEVANAMGIRSILVAGGHHSESRLSACGVPVVSCLSEVIPAVEQALKDKTP
jgi:phosphoglycolate phosphatase